MRGHAGILGVVRFSRTVRAIQIPDETKTYYLLEVQIRTIDK
jgi:hypothetical protein